MKGTLKTIEEFSYKDIAHLLKDFNSIKLKSDIFFDRIVQHILKNKYLGTIDKTDESYVLRTIFILHGNLNN